MLNFLNRDGTVYKNLADRGFSSFKYGDINEVQVEGSGEQYQGKVCYVYDSDTLVGSGIVETYAFDKNSNLSTLKLYPLHYDLRNDFVSDNTGNIVYYDAPLETVLASILTKYAASTTSPLIYAKNLPATGISVKYTFSYKTFLEAWNVLVFSFLPKEMNVLVEPDGGVSIITAPTSRQLSFGHDVQKIKYEKRTDEIVNYVVFDNKRADNHILKTYQDTASIAAHGKRVRYWDDARVQYESTADTMVAAFFSKSTKATIEVEDITTTNTEVQIYDKITINNWEKDFDDDLFVVGISTLKGGKRQLRIGTQLTRSILNQQGDIESVNESVEALAGSMPSLPSYIKETYIDSTEIRSPVIAGNNGYFTQTFRVGSNGIVIDGAAQVIKSASYNAANHTGWQIANSGAFEFGGDANNYLKWDGSNLYIKGVLDWGDIDNRPADSAILNTSQQWNDIQSRPTYIQNTYISSTEVRSPQISGSSGYFTDTFYVGQNGIVIDGIGKFIKSSNYDPYASTGWKIENSGNFFFGGSANNFIKWDGSLLEIRGLIKATQYDYYGSTPSYQEGLLWSEQSALGGGRKVLWWYFGGDTNKQQVSMSRMQLAYSFDKSNGSQTYNINTWFQPRMVIFNGFFENVGGGIYGTVQGQAGSVSYANGMCSYFRNEMANRTFVTDISFTSNFPRNNGSLWANTGKLPVDFNGTGNATSWLGTASYPASNSGWSYYGVATSYNAINTSYVQGTNVGYSGSYFATSHFSNNEAAAQVTNWRDNGLDFSVSVQSGWRLAGNLIIIG